MTRIIPNNLKLMDGSILSGCVDVKSTNGKTSLSGAAGNAVFAIYRISKNKHIQLCLINRLKPQHGCVSESKYHKLLHSGDYLNKASLFDTFKFLSACDLL